MTSEALKAKGNMYEVLESSYFFNAEFLTAEDEQGSIYDFLKEFDMPVYKEWLKEHENDYYFGVVEVENSFYAVAFEYGDRAAWAVEIESI